MSDRVIRTYSRPGLFDWNNQVNFPAPAAPTGLLLDSISNVTNAWGFRKLRSAYAGNAIQVRESGGDTLGNIGFSGSDLDATAIATLCGANSGFVRTWYDQAGSVDLPQPTTTLQTRIRNAGTNDTLNSKPCQISIGSTTTGDYDGFDATGTLLTLPQPLTVAVCFKMNNLSASAFGGFCDGNPSGQRVLFGTTQDPADKYQMFAGTGPVLGGTADLTTHSAFAIFNGATSDLYIDGTRVLNTVNVGTSGFANGARFLGNQDGWGIQAYVAEMILLNAIISSTDMATVRASWQSYWGAP